MCSVYSAFPIVGCSVTCMLRILTAYVKCGGHGGACITCTLARFASYQMHQTKAMLGSVALPCFDLNTNKVLLPGLAYSIILPLERALSIISRYRNQIPSSSPLKSLIIENDAYTSIEPLSLECVKGIAHVNSHLDLYDIDVVSNSSHDPLPLTWFVFGVLPPNVSTLSAPAYPKVVTIANVCTIEKTVSGLVLTIKAVARGLVVNASDCNEMDVLPQSPSLVDISLSKYKVIGHTCDQLFDKIDTFRSDYLQASKLEDYSASDPGRSLLALNPCASVLFLHFAGSSYQIHALTSVVKFYETCKLAKNDNFISRNYERLMDVTCAVLPFPIKAKLLILSELNIEKRETLLINMLRSLASTLDQLKKNTSFVDSWFNEEASGTQQEDLIALQLRSLRKVLNDQRNSLKPQSVNHVSGKRTKSLSPANKKYSENQSSLAIDQGEDDFEEFHNFVTKVLPNIQSLPPDSKRLIERDFKRLSSYMKSGAITSMDANVLRNYLEIVMDIPWLSLDASSPSDIEISKAQKQLESDHYGLQKVKSRLLQYLVVVKLLSQNAEQAMKTEAAKRKIPTTTLISSNANAVGTNAIKGSRENKSPIIMLVGPPGTGKTSLATSIAKALGRSFQRISLGGIKDESDIRGHRRTYVGAMPGAIIQALRKGRSLNPVILLDEIDKVAGGHTGSRVNGDPAAALLEVLDPEQNSSFTDHYLGIPVDLSQVIFVCTANDASGIPPALRDRLEIIKLEAYDISEKLAIGKAYLLPRQITRNGFPTNLPRSECVSISDELLRTVILDYTSEAGVRSLERKLATICRYKAVEYNNATQASSGLDYKPTIHEADLGKYLGPARRVVDTSAIVTTTSNRSSIGIVNGLSYNSDGSGSLLVFECVGIDRRHSGNYDTHTVPALQMTGSLGKVLLESAKISLIFVKLLVFRDMLQVYEGPSENLAQKFINTEFYLHAPFGSIPKDGPSAGVAITLLILSLVLGKEVPPNIAITGEITLRGLILPVGGIKEKLFGAHLSGNIRRVILPRDNRRDLIEEFQNRCETKVDLRTEYGLTESDMRQIWLDEKNGDFSNCLVEKYFKESYGLQILYAKEFYDVIKHVWGEDEHFTIAIEPRVSEHHL